MDETAKNETTQDPETVFHDLVHGSEEQNLDDEVQNHDVAHEGWLRRCCDRLQSQVVFTIQKRHCLLSVRA